MKFFYFVVCFTILYFFCESQTKNFRIQEIKSDFPNHLFWDFPQQKETETLPKLSQNFYYLNSGEQCHVFLGEDQKTVLKFFRRTDEKFLRFIHKLPFQLQSLFKIYDPFSAFESARIAFRSLKERAGIMYLHLNKTENQLPKVALFDPIGVRHEIELDKTEFLLQDYCELAFKRIGRQIQENNITGAKASIQAILEAAEEWSRQGLYVTDNPMRKNIGFCGDKVILFDIGSIQKRTQPQSKEIIQKEILKMVHPLRRWIRKHHLEFLPYFEEEVSAVTY